MKKKRISQSVLNALLAVCFFTVIPILKIISICTSAFGKKSKKSSWRANVSKELPQSSLLGTRWGIGWYMFHKRKYYLVPFCWIILILSIFFGKRAQSGKISDSVYEMT